MEEALMGKTALKKASNWTGARKWQSLMRIHPGRAMECFPRNLLRANQKIHHEAAPGLHGENVFKWDTGIDKCGQLWRISLSTRICLPRLYSRLITKIHLTVSVCHTPKRVNEDLASMLDVNVKDISTKLSLNDLRSLRIGVFYSSGRHFVGNHQGIGA